VVHHVCDVDGMLIGSGLKASGGSAAEQTRFFELLRSAIDVTGAAGRVMPRRRLCGLCWSWAEPEWKNLSGENHLSSKPGIYEHHIFCSFIAMMTVILDIPARLRIEAAAQAAVMKRNHGVYSYMAQVS
jgi:hypothetical protein